MERSFNEKYIVSKLPNHFQSVLVTGGSGFIGGNVIRYLLKNTEGDTPTIIQRSDDLLLNVL